MSIEYTCDGCDFQGRVSPAKAGSVVECPSCGSEVEVGEAKAVSVAKARTTSADGNVGTIIGIGAGVLVAGLLILFALKSMQAEQGSQEIASTDPIGNETVAVPVLQIPPTDSTTIAPEPDRSAADNSATNSSQSDEPDAEPDFSLPAMKAVDPAQILLSQLSNVTLVVERFEKDDRGAVAQAVTAATERALQRCRLTTQESATAPRLIVALSLDTSTGLQKLKLDASLEGDMQGLPVTVWQRTDSVMPLDDRALASGVIPPALDREVGEFFTSLREKIVAARRVVNARLKTKEIQDSP